MVQTKIEVLPCRFVGNMITIPKNPESRHKPYMSQLTEEGTFKVIARISDGLFLLHRTQFAQYHGVLPEYKPSLWVLIHVKDGIIDRGYECLGRRGSYLRKVDYQIALYKAYLDNYIEQNYLSTP